MNPLYKLFIFLVIYLQAFFLSIRSRLTSNIETLTEIDEAFERLEIRLDYIRQL